MDIKEYFSSRGYKDTSQAEYLYTLYTEFIGEDDEWEAKSIEKYGDVIYHASVKSRTPHPVDIYEVELIPFELQDLKWLDTHGYRLAPGFVKETGQNIRDWFWKE